MKKLYIKVLDNTATIPSKATEFSAGMDLHAAFKLGDEIIGYNYLNKKIKFEVYEVEDESFAIMIEPNDTVLIPTKLILGCDSGNCIKAYPRSGKSLKNKLTLINCVGVIDADYQQECFITIVNHSDVAQTIHSGDALAQIMVEPVEDVLCVFDQMPELNTTRNGGFGSTGN